MKIRVVRGYVLTEQAGWEVKGPRVQDGDNGNFEGMTVEH